METVFLLLLVQVGLVQHQPMARLGRIEPGFQAQE